MGKDLNPKTLLCELRNETAFARMLVRELWPNVFSLLKGHFKEREETLLSFFQSCLISFLVSDELWPREQRVFCLSSMVHVTGDLWKCRKNDTTVPWDRDKKDTKWMGKRQETFFSQCWNYVSRIIQTRQWKISESWKYSTLYSPNCEFLVCECVCLCDSFATIRLSRLLFEQGGDYQWHLSSAIITMRLRFTALQSSWALQMQKVIMQSSSTHSSTSIFADISPTLWCNDGLIWTWLLIQLDGSGRRSVCYAMFTNKIQSYLRLHHVMKLSLQ